MNDSGVIVFGLALGMMVGMLGTGVRAVLLAIRRGGDTDFWNIKAVLYRWQSVENRGSTVFGD